MHPIQAFPYNNPLSTSRKARMRQIPEGWIEIVKPVVRREEIDDYNNYNQHDKKG